MNGYSEIRYSLKPITSMREKVDRLEQELIKVKQVDCPTKHYHAPGVLGREIFIPKGTTLIGAVHKTESLAVLASGRLLLVTDSGTVEVCAPFVTTVKPGQKNAALALEDSVWINFHHNPTNETDIEVLAEMFTELKASELLGGKDNKQLIANRLAELEGE